MIQDERWVRRQVIDLWFQCSQEQIASHLGISLGKLNSIIQEYTKSHGRASKIRDIVISAKKNGVDINQIISNDRFVNAVKKFGSDKDKLELLLRSLGQIISQNDGEPTIAAPIIYQILEIAYKLHKSPAEVLKELESSSKKLRTTEDQIQASQTDLKNNHVTIEEIQTCKEFMNNLRKLGFSDLAETNNVLNNIRKQRGDAQQVLNLLSRYFSVKQVLSKLTDRVFENIGVLEELADKSYARGKSVDICTRIIKMGYTEQAITHVLKIIEDVMLEYNDGPNSGNLFLAQLREDLLLYGSLSAANIGLKYRNLQLSSRQMPAH